jgi:hypothetical protein
MQGRRRHIDTGNFPVLAMLAVEVTAPCAQRENRSARGEMKKRLLFYRVNRYRGCCPIIQGD